MGRSEREILKVLVKRVSLSGSSVRWLVDQHGVNGFNVFSDEVLKVGDQRGIVAETKEHLVILPILDLGDASLSLDLDSLFGQ